MADSVPAMTAHSLILICLLVVAAGHFIGIAVLLFRAPPNARQSLPDRPPVTILRPARGIENHIEETLASAYAIDYPDYEVVYCVADANDPIVPVIRRLIASHPEVPSRLLTGDDRISNNPKLNNLVKGWRAAAHDWIVMADSNVLMPPDYLDLLLARSAPEVGLVCSPPLGTAPEGAGAELECAFLNTYQARWQLIADAFGTGFAQGKSMLWRRADLDRIGGITALAAATAEDIAATHLLRKANLKVRLAHRPFPQPLGRRSLAEVWQRQLRWAQLRRAGLTSIFLLEPLTYNALAFALIALAYGGEVTLSGWILILAVWYGAEALLARVYNWPLSLWAPLTWLVRDIMLPFVWTAALLTQTYTWRGNEVITSAKASPGTHGGL
jgi:ceramide glucosyltransferase